MKKKIFALLFAVVLCISSVLPVMATSKSARIVDDAGLLSESEFMSIAQKLDEISDRQQFEVVIHTTYDTNGKSITRYADDYFDDNGYGYGSSRDGCILVIDMDDRNWKVSTSGKGIEYITDSDISYIGDKIGGYLSSGNYYNAFMTYADICDDLANGPSYNWFLGIVVSLVVGFVIALIATLIMKGQLKSVRRQPAAKDYLVPGSLNVTSSRDMFLYRNVTKRARPKQNSGSSTHTSSSGRTHGGGGGSF